MNEYKIPYHTHNLFRQNLKLKWFYYKFSGNKTKEITIKTLNSVINLLITD